VRIGDYVRLDSGAEGYVADFNWRATSIRMLANNIVIVPNAKLAQATITNYDQPTRDVAIAVEVGVHYQSDLARVERVTEEVARGVMADVAGAFPDAQPVVRFQAFGPTSVTFSVGLRAREFSDQFLLKHEFIKRLHARYAKEGIVIPHTALPLDARLSLAPPPPRPSE
jgi:small-conductance mechanosensitive channel